MAAIKSGDWVLVAVGFVGAAILAWAAHLEAKQNEYHKAIHEAYMRDYERRQAEVDTTKHS